MLKNTSIFALYLNKNNKTMQIKHSSILLAFLFFTIIQVSCSEKQDHHFDFDTRFEKSEGLETATYSEIVTFYEALAKAHPSISVYSMQKTDSGRPLQLVTYNPDRTFTSEFGDERSKTLILINNGIHPGESDGIDASMMLMRDLAEGKIKSPKNTIVAVIPVYNIGGALHRNYDLNRDFIKTDTKNALAFTDIFRTIKPDVFIDNHVSNGADYQYTLTHLFTQHNKLGGPLGEYLHTSFMPQLEDSLALKKWDITPYVNVFNSTPEKGFSQFNDSPRYSTGYTSLYNTLGMMVETHMLKPYKERVEGTYELMSSMINIVDADADVIIAKRIKNFNHFKKGDVYPLSWSVDTTKASTLTFKGYEGEMIDSEITGFKRLKFDKEKPFTKEVSYQNYFTPTTSVTIPEKYIIPKGYWNVIDRLRENKVRMTSVKKDSTMDATVYHIADYKTRQSPYEGHYLHYNTTIIATTENVAVRKGDLIVDTNQEGMRYLLETLEPAATDSFFNWNFFDTILQQKEGFSPYVWEDQAKKLLDDNPDVMKAFEAKKKAEPSFAKSWYAQLDWLHKKSPNYEEAHLRYPIIRVGG
jgi:hypothetical protein